MSATLIGFSRCSMGEQDLIAQRLAPLSPGVAEDWSHPAVARAKATLTGEQPKLSARRHALPAAGEYSVADPAELFSACRQTVCRALQRVGGCPAGGCWAEGRQHGG